MKLVCHRTDQPADNRADCRSSERDPTGVPAVMDVVNEATFHTISDKNFSLP